MPRPKKQSNSDPLLAALIAKLPPAGDEWPTDQQVSWLHLMAIGMGVAYGGNAAMVFEKQAGTSNVVPMPKFQRRTPEYDFVIDEKGFVRGLGGKRLMPQDVKGTLYDLNGETEAGDITWADGSTGLAGLPAGTSITAA